MGRGGDIWHAHSALVTQTVTTLNTRMTRCAHTSHVQHACFPPHSSWTPRWPLSSCTPHSARRPPPTLPPGLLLEWETCASGGVSSSADLWPIKALGRMIYSSSGWLKIPKIQKYFASSSNRTPHWWSKVKKGFTRRSLGCRGEVLYTP